MKPVGVYNLHKFCLIDNYLKSVEKGRSVSPPAGRTPAIGSSVSYKYSNSFRKGSARERIGTRNLRSEGVLGCGGGV